MAKEEIHVTEEEFARTMLTLQEKMADLDALEAKDAREKELRKSMGKEDGIVGMLTPYQIASIILSDKLGKIGVDVKDIADIKFSETSTSTSLNGELVLTCKVVNDGTKADVMSKPLNLADLKSILLAAGEGCVVETDVLHEGTSTTFADMGSSEFQATTKIVSVEECERNQKSARKRKTAKTSPCRKVKLLAKETPENLSMTESLEYQVKAKVNDLLAQYKPSKTATPDDHEKWLWATAERQIAALRGPSPKVLDEVTPEKVGLDVIKGNFVLNALNMWRQQEKAIDHWMKYGKPCEEPTQQQSTNRYPRTHVDLSIWPPKEKTEDPKMEE